MLTGEAVRRSFDPLVTLLREFEGLRLAPYRDTGGLWHIGYGHLIVAGERFAPYGPCLLYTSPSPRD